MAECIVAPTDPARPFISLRGYRGRQNLYQHIWKRWNWHANQGHEQWTGDQFTHINEPSQLPESPVPGDAKPEDDTLTEARVDGTLCIIGAGATGLYLAYLLEQRNIAAKAWGVEPFKYDILEGSERSGGRVYTKYFAPGKDTAEIPHNYYDAGAMRIPAISSMQPLIDLANDLKVPLAPYWYSQDTAPQLYYNQPLFSTEGITKKLDAVMQPFMQDIDRALKAHGEGIESWDLAIKSILDETEPYSTREYLRTKAKPNWTPDEINLAELIDTSTGLFDQSMTESVIDYYDFQHANTVNWWRVEGGMSKLTDALEATLPSGKVQLNQEVTDIELKAESEFTALNVKTTSDDVGKSFHTVISTVSLPCLQRINTFGPLGDDTRGLGFSNAQLDAIRCLHYDVSTKIALRFTEPWWITVCGIGTDTTFGGIGSTDLPIRTVVYPSWYDKGAEAHVLIASYTWAQDATRAAALANSSSKERLINKVLHDLARLHRRKSDKISYKFLKDLLYTADGTEGIVDYKDWSTDPYTGGAFALFGPGQFSSLYPALTIPTAGGRFLIAGEHASAHHAWIIGSMSSAIQALGAWFLSQGMLKSHAWLRDFKLPTQRNQDKSIVDLIDEVDLSPRGISHLLAALGHTAPGGENIAGKGGFTSQPPKKASQEFGTPVEHVFPVTKW